MIKLFDNYMNPKSAFISLLMLILIYANINAQDNKAGSITVNGVVIDATTKLPVTSAQIKALNYPSATSVNENGRFSISISNYSEVLSISAVDFRTREVAVRGNDSLIVELYPVFFSDRYKKVETLSGFVNNSLTTTGISSFERPSISTSLSIDNEIETQLGGNVRSISRSAQPGIGSSLFIQGYNSINANAQPLFVVDGVIWESNYDEVSIHSGYFSNPLLTIDVMDIENITVLKDGTSLYGSKGSNGVILISTKRARDMVTKINASTFWGITTEPKLIPVMNASQSMIYESEMFQGASGISNSFLNNDPSVTSYPRFHNSTDWSKEVYRTGMTQSYNINVTGGDDRALYMFSMGYSGNNGIIKNTDYSRFNTRFNADINLARDFLLTWNIDYVDVNRNMMNDGVNMVSPSFLAYVKPTFLAPFEYAANGETTSLFEDADDFHIGNPSAVVENSVNTSKQNRFNIGIMPTWKISKHVTLQNQFGYSVYNVRESFFRHSQGSDSVYISKYDILAGNEARNQQSKNLSIYNDSRIVLNYAVNNSHFFKAIAGWRYINKNYNLNYGIGYNTSNNSPGLDNAKVKERFGILNKYKTMSVYTNLDYSYRSRYILSLTYDMDASSRFGSEIQGAADMFGVKWGIFPSISGAWVVSSEKFMKNIRLINSLKIRGGYGITGNDDIGYYDNTGSLISKSYIGVYSGLIIGNIATPDIKWETTRRLNAGVDLAMFNERLTLSAGFYKSKTSDLIMPIQYPDVVGLSYYIGNSGSLENNGYDLNIGIKALNLNTVKWELGASVGHYKNKLTSLPDGSMLTQIYGGEIISQVGSPVGLFYGYKTNGVYSTQAQAQNDGLYILDDFGKSHYYGAGDIKFVDVNHDQIINNQDKQVIGDPNPDYYGSFNSMLQVGNITIDALFTFSYGNDVYNYLRSQLESGSSFNNQSVTMVNRWRTEGQQTSQPKAVYGDPMHNSAFSDRWIEDGSYLKFKTLSVNYKVPLKTKVVQGLNIWASVNNLFTLTKYLGTDPEFSALNPALFQGIDAGLLPSSKSYFVGLNINL